MKLNEQFIDGEGSTFHVKKTYDLAPVLQQNADLRSAEDHQTGDMRLIGTLPGWLVMEWLKEAGVRPDDPAASDVLRRKLTDSDNSKLRVWEGRY